MWEPDTLRAGSAGPGRSEDGMSGKKKSGSARAVPRAYGRLTRHERDTVQRMLERWASCREIARELGRSPSTVSAEVASHRFVTAPKARRGERVDASADLSAACPRLATWPRCCNGCCVSSRVFLIAFIFRKSRDKSFGFHDDCFAS